MMNRTGYRQREGTGINNFDAGSHALNHLNCQAPPEVTSYDDESDDPFDQAINLIFCDPQAETSLPWPINEGRLIGLDHFPSLTRVITEENMTNSAPDRIDRAALSSSSQGHRVQSFYDPKPNEISPCNSDASYDTSSESLKKAHDEVPEATSDDPSLKAVERPKRSLTAYNLFFQAERKKLIAELPPSASARNGKRSKRKKKSGLGFADLAKTVSARWKALHPDQKLEFQLLAAEDLKRYESEMAVWKKLEMAREMKIWRISQAKLDRERREQEERQQVANYFAL